MPAAVVAVAGMAAGSAVAGAVLGAAAVGTFAYTVVSFATSMAGPGVTGGVVSAKERDLQEDVP